MSRLTRALPSSSARLYDQGRLRQVTVPSRLPLPPPTV
ncbi:Uncharacterised protein [Bordetella pertussis]|nr:Uncharacterised protein [Bordetella pertussis]